MRRSIVAARQLKSNEIITENIVDYKRPGTGIQPSELKYILGKRLIRDVDADSLLSWDDFF